MTSISKPASALRPGETLVRHPDHPDQRVRYRIIAGARGVGDGVIVDYTAPADELAGLTPNGRASGVLLLDATQPCEVEVAAAHVRSVA